MINLLTPKIVIDARTCPGCGTTVPVEDFDQGYCIDCLAARQNELDQFNATYREWSGLSDSQRLVRIREAMNRG